MSLPLALILNKMKSMIMVYTKLSFVLQITTLITIPVIGNSPCHTSQNHVRISTFLTCYFTYIRLTHLPPIIKIGQI